MKKIYSFTLDDEVPLSDNFGSDMREIAFWIYEELGKFNVQITCVDDENTTDSQGLIKNDLYDIKEQNKYIYKFASDDSKIDSRMYEPFVLNDRGFAFTINEGTITDGDIVTILNYVLSLLRLDYKFNINSVSYDESNIKNRFIAIRELLKDKSEEQNKTKKRVKLQLKPIVTIMGLWL